MMTRRVKPGFVVAAAACLALVASPSRAQGGLDDFPAAASLPSVADLVRAARQGAQKISALPLPDDMGLKRYLRGLMDARQMQDAADGQTNAELPRSLPVDWPRSQGFVPFRKIPGDFLVAVINGNEIAFEDGQVALGIRLSQVVNQEEAALLPPGRTIRRAIAQARYQGKSWSYEVWHYPPGTQVIHLIADRATGRVIELRLQRKLPDGPRGEDGPWAFAIYRPQDGRNPGRLYLYAPKTGAPPESKSFALPGEETFLWTRLSADSCRSCHISMGDGWYQYPDESRAGPCGFVPANPDLLGDWAARYRKLHGYFPFSGPTP